MYSTKSEYYDLPIKYNETVIRLLVQSPSRMYAYWDVSESTIAELTRKKCDYNFATPVLKIFNKTKNYSYELPVDPYANNYYIEVTDIDCEYEVVLGRKNNNKFVDIYHSNVAKVPRSFPCSYDDEVIFRNYICYDKFKKIKVYVPKRNIKQGYYDLDFSSDYENNPNSSSMYRQ